MGFVGLVWLAVFVWSMFVLYMGIKIGIKCGVGEGIAIAANLIPVDHGSPPQGG